MLKRHIFAVLFGICLLVLPVQAKYSGGTGTAEDPYQIANPSDLLLLAADTNDYNDCFILTDDVDLAGQIFTTTAIIAADTSPSGGFQGVAFTGTFDGNGYKITNFTINGESNWFFGLFGYIASGGSVKNLGLENFSVSGYWFVGGLVGSNKGSISNCYSTGTISGSQNSECVGGLVGCNDSSINNCYFTGVVSGSESVGGLAGDNYHGSISNCYSTGVVSGDCCLVGGLVGSNNGGSINNCYSMGTVNGTSDCVGGLVGYNNSDYSNSSISNCYSMGAVSGSSNVGGLVGYNGGSINNCYSTGAVSGEYGVGGLVGFRYGGSIFNSFWDVNTSGTTDGVGNIDPDPNGVTGLPISQMQDINTFTSAGWDFDYTDGNEADWFIQIDEYPILVWQISPADIYTDGRNNFRDFAVFAEYWMRDDCAIYNAYCDWADLDFNGSVDIDDLIEFMNYWLESGIYN